MPTSCRSDNRLQQSGGTGTLLRIARRRFESQNAPAFWAQHATEGRGSLGSDPRQIFEQFS
jgi:hypothetical protein